MDKQSFQNEVWQQGRRLFRPMPWRHTTHPYNVLVSELMLQQTQVDRVVPKFVEFMTAFPTISALAAAPLSDVLILWSGLGYNRRAKYLHAAAKEVMHLHSGTIPFNMNQLMALPGIGPNTAGAIMAYGFNQPVAFIETNIRTVYFHHFFHDQALVTDAELKKVVEMTLDSKNPREWYWALMDYGSYLKKQGVGRLQKSSHYKKQTPLKGSIREVRGIILKQLAAKDMTEQELRMLVPDDERYEKALNALVSEGFVTKTTQSPSRLHLTT